MKKNPRVKSVLLRFSEAEYQRLKEKSGSAVFAKWCRNVLLEKEIEVFTKTNYKPVDPDLMRELSRISSNINQIAKAINTGRIGKRELKNSEILGMQLSLLGINEFIDEVRNAHQAVKE